MSETKDDLEIKVEDDAVAPEPADIEVEKVEAAPVFEKPEVSTEDAMANLLAQLDAEKARAAAAEQRAQQAAVQTHAAESEVEQTNLQLINSAIEQVKAFQANLKANLKSAIANGDVDAQADIYEAMGNASAKMMQLETGKQAMETAPKREPPRAVAPDPVEAIAAQLSPRSAAWVRAHPEFATDQRKFQRMLAAHNLAVNEDISPDTDEYFAAIEDTLKVRPRAAAAVDEPTEAAAQVVQRRSSPAAAPVSRTVNGTAPRPGVVRLSREEREAAADMGMTEADYAKNKYALQKEGKLH
jgi:hypothetical protein